MSLESVGRGAEGGGGGQRRRLLNDPRAIRALAHPIRLELLSIVGRIGRITTADLARELGISHALASHHLHQLAKYDFVHQVAGADNRERPWELVHTSLSAEGIEGARGGAAARGVLERVEAERALHELHSWQERRPSWSEGWNRSSGLGRSTIYLTEGELAELVASIDALVNRYVDERPLDDLESRPAGSSAVSLTWIVAPQDPLSMER